MLVIRIIPHFCNTFNSDKNHLQAFKSSRSVLKLNVGNIIEIHLYCIKYYYVSGCKLQAVNSV